ncbi:hypothetical protein AMTRI_Chr13g86440 [Amborella trichopoda]
MDDQIEVVNRCLENYVRCFAGARPKEWAKWLSMAHWQYSTSTHTSTQMTPYEVVYGVAPPRLLLYVPNTTVVQAVEELLMTRDQISIILKENLLLA